MLSFKNHTFISPRSFHQGGSIHSNPHPLSNLKSASKHSINPTFCKTKSLFCTGKTTTSTKETPKEKKAEIKKEDVDLAKYTTFNPQGFRLKWLPEGIM
jgi:hypothetical protein